MADNVQVTCIRKKGDHFNPHAGDAHADHTAIMQLGTAFTDLQSEPGNCLTVHVSHARNRALAHALAEGGDDVDLLISGKDVHGGFRPTCCGTNPKRDSGSAAQGALYVQEWSFASGFRPGVDDPGPPLLAQ